MPYIKLPRYNGQLVVDYNDAKHSLRFPDAEETALSVTGCTGVIDKPFLLVWAEKLAREHLLAILESGEQITPEDVLTATHKHTVRKDEAGDIGKAVHKWAENDAKEIAQDIPDDPKMQNGIMAYLEWKRKYQPKFLFNEKMIISKRHGYWGIMDAACTYGSEDHKFIRPLEFKTAGGFYLDFNWQVSACQEAEAEEFGTIYNGPRTIARFDKETGSFEVKELPQSEHQTDFEAFLHCHQLKLRMRRDEAERKKEWQAKQKQ